MQIIEEIIKNIPNGIYYLAVAYIVWKAAHFYFVRFRDIEKKVCDVDGIKKKIDDEIGPVLVKINSTSDRIARYIITKDSLNPAFFSTASPIELNTFAKEVLTESGAKNFIDNSFAFLSSAKFPSRDRTDPIVCRRRERRHRAISSPVRLVQNRSWHS